MSPGTRLGTREACPRCGSDLHCCRNCRFFDPGKNNQCSEPQAEWVRDKEAANYCDYFEAASQSLVSGARRPGTAGDIRKKFDSLFKD
ncbi:MAG: hypothetical protein ACRD2O_00775 [Terriglobia bacterium]